MTDLRERLRAAEGAGGQGVAADEFSDVFLIKVKRGRARRAAAFATASVVVVMALGAATIAVLKSDLPVEPAKPPTVNGAIVEAPQASRAQVGQTPGDTASRRAWDLIDDRWALALWRSSDTPNSVSGLDVVAVGPDGTTLNVRPLAGLGQMQIIAWSPVFATALVSNQPEGADSVSVDAQLGVIDLDGGEDSWTAECLEPEKSTAVPVRQIAAPVGGGYAVRNACGEEFFMDGGGRTELTQAQHRALLNAEFPGMHLTDIEHSERGAQLHQESISVSVTYDPSACTLLIRTRTNDFGSGCVDGPDFVLDNDGQPIAIRPLPGIDSAVRIDRLCGFDGVVGQLSDGTAGVGVLTGDIAAPLLLDGERASVCEDGKLTWYVAGGDLYSVTVDGVYTRLVDLVGAQGEDSEGLGVVDVAPAPLDDSLN